MSEIKENEETTKKSKLESRKFIVWLVWLFIVVINLIIDVIIVKITKTLTAEMVGLTEKIVGWFFAISMMYLGVNAGQKIGFAFADALGEKSEE